MTPISCGQGPSRGFRVALEIVLYSASLAASHGQEHQSRTVSHFEDNGRKLVHQQFNQDAGGKEHLLMELILTRKPAHK